MGAIGMSGSVMGISILFAVFNPTGVLLLVPLDSSSKLNGTECHGLSVGSATDEGPNHGCRIHCLRCLLCLDLPRVGHLSLRPSWWCTLWFALCLYDTPATLIVCS